MARKWKKSLALLLALSMMLGMLSIGALAETAEDPVQDNTQQEEVGEPAPQVELTELDKLKEAIADSDVSEYTLAEDVTMNEPFMITKDFTLNLNGHTITNNVEEARPFIVNQPVSFTINGTTEGSSMVIPEENTNAYGFVDLKVAAKLTVNGGTFTGNVDYASLFKVRAKGSEVTLTNVNATTNYQITGCDSSSISTFVITGGEYRITEQPGSNLAAFYFGNTNDVQLSNVKLTVASCIGVEVYKSKAIIENCTFNSTGSRNSYYTTTLATSGGTSVVTVEGGSFASTNGVGMYVFSSGGTINVDGATISGGYASIHADVDKNTYPNATTHVNLENVTVTGEIKPSGSGVEKVSISIESGTFTDAGDISAYIAPSAILEEDGTVRPRTADDGDTVAEVDGKFYSSLQAAIDAAIEGQTVTLLDDYEVETDLYTSYVLPNDSILELNGKTLTVPFATAIFEGNATIQNGRIESTANYAVWIGNDENDTDITLNNVSSNGGVNVFAAKATLENCNIDASNKQYYAVWVDNGFAAVNIKSGTYIGGEVGVVHTSSGENDDGSVTPPELKIEGGTFTGEVLQGYEGSVSISGGTFTANVSNYCVDGLKAAQQDESGKWVIVPDEGTVAMVSGVSETKTYESLQGAIKAAVAGDTVKLLDNVQLTRDNAMYQKGTTWSGILISKNNITLNGNGKTITADGDLHAIQVYKAADVKIENLTVNGTNGAKDALLVNQGSKVTATGLTTSGSVWGAVNVNKASSFSFDDTCTFNEDNKVWVDGEGSTVTAPESWNSYKDSAGQTFYTSEAVTLTVTPASVRLYSNSGSATANLTATVSGILSGKTAAVTWTSDNEDVATVAAGQDGIVTVTRVGNGTARITASTGSVSDQCTVTVSTYTAPAPTPSGDEELGEGDTPLTDKPFLFTDVKENDWFYDAVKYVFNSDLMNGTSATIFAPYMTTSRAMVVTMLHRLEGTPEASESIYPDMVPGTWYSAAVGWATETAVAKGYTNGNFGPMDNVSREQLASFLYRYAEYKGYDLSATADLSSFADGDETSGWARSAMEWAVGSGVLSGKTGNRLDPTGISSRAEAAQAFKNFDSIFGAEKAEQ